jgi:hypothetical protein
VLLLPTAVDCIDPGAADFELHDVCENLLSNVLLSGAGDWADDVRFTVRCCFTVLHYSAVNYVDGVALLLTVLPPVPID